MQPNGKGPRWENLGLLLFLSGSFLYYYFTKQAISEEITYLDFINLYLAQNK